MYIQYCTEKHLKGDVITCLKEGLIEKFKPILLSHIARLAVGLSVFGKFRKIVGCIAPNLTSERCAVLMESSLYN